MAHVIKIIQTSQNQSFLEKIWPIKTLNLQNNQLLVYKNRELFVWFIFQLSSIPSVEVIHLVLYISFKSTLLNHLFNIFVFQENKQTNVQVLMNILQHIASMFATLVNLTKII